MTELVGRTIREVRRMTRAELNTEGWDAGPGDCPVALLLDDGTKLFPSRDPEGNEPGALFGIDPRGESFGIAQVASAVERAGYPPLRDSGDE